VALKTAGCIFRLTLLSVNFYSLFLTAAEGRLLSGFCRSVTMDTRISELSRQGYCCSQIIMKLGLEKIEKENQDLIAA
jgi:hypothetical protein